MTVTAAPSQALRPSEVAVAYHRRTKHRLDRYAAGPETLDWDAQPNPFRSFAGAVRTLLPLSGGEVAARFGDVSSRGKIAPAPVTISSVGALMQLSMGLSAWKEYGPDRWALRCNPSSGNLHPTEAYVVARGIDGLQDGLHHYDSKDHALEQRFLSTGEPSAEPRLWIGLSSVHWREAWKYGERAFRYCQLDIGHALGALRYAAGALGWRAQVVDGLGSEALAALMGLDRAEDFARAEREDADLLIAIHTDPEARTPAPAPSWEGAAGSWTGRANVLDPHPIYHWPTIDVVSQATHGFGAADPAEPQTYPDLEASSEARAADIILGRRSAQRFDTKFTMSAETFYRLMDRLLPRESAPWDVWGFSPRLHPIVFVHRVEGFEPGVYALPRHGGAEALLRSSLHADFEWQRPVGAPLHLPLFRLARTDCRALSKTISCHQAIASDSSFTVSMLAEFDPIVTANAWRYRQLHWEAGLLGHVLYLEAEAEGVRGTGIGCFFDDALHEALGLTTSHVQALYHFTVGRPLTDTRITTHPAYPDRPPL